MNLRIDGMSCDACVARVKKALAAVVGVHCTHVELDPPRAVVDYDGDKAEQLLAAVTAAGYSGCAES
ncbi:MAG TPA: heavy-metal-associated domain-containing protein [Chthoniobacteraceae bacterium]|jgi:Cu+-exporting ATPase